MLHVRRKISPRMEYKLVIRNFILESRNTLYGLLQAFLIERDPHSRTEIGERDIVLSA
jgi:hypothetical protein